MVSVRLVGYKVDGFIDNINAPEHLHLMLEISGNAKELVEMLKLINETLQDKPYVLEMNLYIMPSACFLLKTTVNAKVLADIVKTGFCSEKIEVRELAQKIHDVVAKIFPKVFNGKIVIEKEEKR